MTGSDVKQVREAMKLDPFEFAAMLGVHVSSVYRWEGSKKVHLAPLYETVVAKLWGCPNADLSDLGAKVHKALMGQDGTIRALSTVLVYLLAR